MVPQAYDAIGGEVSRYQRICMEVIPLWSYGQTSMESGQWAWETC